jgi:hypothetical protein
LYATLGIWEFGIYNAQAAFPLISVFLYVCMPLRYFEFHTKLYLRPKGSTPLGKFRH